MTKRTYIIYTSLFVFALWCKSNLAAQSKSNVSRAGSATVEDNSDGPREFIQSMPSSGSRNKQQPLLRQEEVELCLFDADMLKQSYRELTEMQKFFYQHNAEEFYSICVAGLFRDRIATGTRECYPPHKLYVLMGTEPLEPRTNAGNLLTELLGKQGYDELNFSTSYLGFSYTDAELWQLYFEKNRQAVADLLKYDRISPKLRFYILALDIEEKLCKFEGRGLGQAM
jgi:hypothetical protein